MKVNDAVVLSGAFGGLGRAVSEALFKAVGRRVFARLSGQPVVLTAKPGNLPRHAGRGCGADPAFRLSPR